MTPDGEPPYALSAPPAPEMPALEGSVTADVALVGAGFSGLIAGLDLLRRGLGVVLIEAGEIGHGGFGPQSRSVHPRVPLPRSRKNSGRGFRLAARCGAPRLRTNRGAGDRLRSGTERDDLGGAQPVGARKSAHRARKVSAVRQGRSVSRAVGGDGTDRRARLSRRLGPYRGRPSEPRLPMRADWRGRLWTWAPRSIRRRL